jgi:hypothetical protein
LFYHHLVGIPHLLPLAPIVLPFSSSYPSLLLFHRILVVSPSLRSFLLGFPSCIPSFVPLPIRSSPTFVKANSNPDNEVCTPN